MDFGSGEIVSLVLVGLLYAVILAIPIYLIWLLIKIQRKVSRIDPIEEEIKKLRDDIHALSETLNGKSPQ